MAAHTWAGFRFTANLLKRTIDLKSVHLSQSRQRGRSLRREVVRVLTPQEEEEKLSHLKGNPKTRPGPSNNNKNVKGSFEQKENDPKSLVSVQGKHNLQRPPESKSFKFEKLRDSDDFRFGPAIMAVKSPKDRHKKREILLEGTRLIRDALQAGAVLKSLFFSKAEAVEGLPMKDLKVPVYKVQHHYLKLWSDMVTPAGVMGIFQMPKQGEISIERCDTIPVTLVCDNVRDPGNMGTIIRAGAAVGCERILASKGCVDVWEPKVLRAGAGSHFRVPIISQLEWETLNGYFPPEARLYLADVGQISDDSPVQFRRRMSEEALQEILARSEETNDFVEDSTDTSTTSEDQSTEDSPYNDKDLLKLFSRLSLPSHIYHQVDYTGAPSVLIVGNESHGPSPKAKKATFDHYGHSVVVPMSASVESLNTSVAAAIIMFEIKRQLTIKQSVKEIG